jgi:23S rRNA (cytosine1962-C5)-methyltransferase
MNLLALLENALHARQAMLAADPKHESALRLFNGFTEGFAALAVDAYATTLVVHDYGDGGDAASKTAQEFLLARLPWLRTVLIKKRKAATEAERNGVVVYGDATARWVREHGVRYAIDLHMNHDCSLYLDTRNVRGWALGHLKDKRVLNTFAYTGSLGVAAAAAGAAQVLHVDLNRRFLNLAKTSYTLNGFPIQKSNFQSGDFWPYMNRLKRAGELFDCVFLDPPFFATTPRGTVDTAANMAKLINKVRPLVSDGGYIVAINNALFFSGAEYMRLLENLCAAGYLAVDELILVPQDFAGFASTRVGAAPTDPAPFNHATKIVVLRVRRKIRQSVALG